MSATPPFDGVDWTEVSAEVLRELRLPLYATINRGSETRYYVPDMHVPGLPTEVDTVIRAHFARKMARKLVLDQSGFWVTVGRTNGAASTYKAEVLQAELVAFDVLSVPVGSADGEAAWKSRQAENNRMRRDTAISMAEFITTSLHDRGIRADGLLDVISNARHEFGGG